MARSLFGGRLGDTVYSLFKIGEREVLSLPTDAQGAPRTTRLEVWDSPGGQRLTDLRAADGATAIDELIVPATGEVPEFYGPDGVRTHVYVLDTDGDYARLDARPDHLIDATEAATTEAVDAATAAAGSASTASEAAETATDAAAAAQADAGTATDAAAAAAGSATDADTAAGTATDAAATAGQEAATAGEHAAAADQSATTATQAATAADGHAQAAAGSATAAAGSASSAADSAEAAEAAAATAIGGGVPVARTVNGHPLSADVVLDAADVGAIPDDGRLRPTSSGAEVTGNLEVTGTVDGRDISADGTKLDTIQDGATANATDAQLRDRGTHTGTQPSESISDLLEAIQDAIGAYIAPGANLTKDYNEATGVTTLSIVPPGEWVNTDPEVVRDVIGGALAGAGNIDVQVNDAEDTITIALIGRLPDANLPERLAQAELDNRYAPEALALPPGGTAGQVPIKASAADGDAAWGNPAGGDLGAMMVASYSGLYVPSTAYAKDRIVVGGAPKARKAYRSRAALAANTHGTLMVPTRVYAGHAHGGTGGNQWTTGSTGSVPLTNPTGLQEGDVVFVYYAMSGATANAAAVSAGWVELYNRTLYTSTEKAFLYYRVVPAGATTVEVASIFTAAGVVSVTAFRGTTFAPASAAQFVANTDYRLYDFGASSTPSTAVVANAGFANRPRLEFNLYFSWSGNVSFTSLTISDTGRTSTYNPAQNVPGGAANWDKTLTDNNWSASSLSSNGSYRSNYLMKIPLYGHPLPSEASWEPLALLNDLLS